MSNKDPEGLDYLMQIFNKQEVVRAARAESSGRLETNVLEPFIESLRGNLNLTAMDTLLTAELARKLIKEVRSILVEAPWHGGIELMRFLKGFAEEEETALRVTIERLERMDPGSTTTVGDMHLPSNE